MHRPAKEAIKSNVVAAWNRSHSAFPWPQTILKQWEDWHVIVSCNQLGETLKAAPNPLSFAVYLIPLNRTQNPSKLLIIHLLRQLDDDIPYLRQCNVYLTLTLIHISNTFTIQLQSFTQTDCVGRLWCHSTDGNCYLRIDNRKFA